MSIIPWILPALAALLFVWCAGVCVAGTLRPATIEALEGEGFSLTILPFRTTAENLARHFCESLRERGLPCAQVDVYETPLNCATYLVD